MGLREDVMKACGVNEERSVCAIEGKRPPVRPTFGSAKPRPA